MLLFQRFWRCLLIRVKLYMLNIMEEEEVIQGILQAGEIFVSCGGNEADTWLALNSQDGAASFL